MAKKKTFIPPLQDDEPALVVGRWYLFTAPGGFTLFGQYVRPLGLSTHRFKNVTHLRHAGDLALSEICWDGLGEKTRIVPRFPRYWNGTPIWWSDYCGPTPWVEAGHDES